MYAGYFGTESDLSVVREPREEESILYQKRSSSGNSQDLHNSPERNVRIKLVNPWLPGTTIRIQYRNRKPSEELHGVLAQGEALSGERKQLCSHSFTRLCEDRRLRPLVYENSSSDHQFSQFRAPLSLTAPGSGFRRSHTPCMLWLIDRGDGLDRTKQDPQRRLCTLSMGSRKFPEAQVVQAVEFFFTSFIFHIHRLCERVSVYPQCASR